MLKYQYVTNKSANTNYIMAMGGIDELYASIVAFTNGAYYTYVNDFSVSTTTPAKSAADIQSTYGTLTVTSASATNTLTVALRNELGAADTYMLTATNGTEVYNFVKSGVTFEDGKYYEITVKMKPGIPLANAKEGMIVGSNGRAYDGNFYSILPSGVTAAGMVAYKSGSNGLVIALSDKGAMDWDTAVGKSGAAAHTPAVTGQIWKLPSQDEWKQMFGAFGGNQTSYTGLNTAIGNAGGTALQKSANYWTSQEVDADKAYRVYLYGGYATFGNDYKYYVNFRVRACFAF